MIIRGGIQHRPRPGHAYHCAECRRPVRADMVRERVQVSPPARTLFHSATMRDFRECGGAIIEVPA